MNEQKKVSILALGLATATVALGFCGCAAQRYGGETAQDVEVSKRVQYHLANDPMFGYPGVEVYTAQGVTDLKGYGWCWQQIERAHNVAMFTKGVGQVQNDIVQQQ